MFSLRNKKLSLHYPQYPLLSRGLAGFCRLGKHIESPKFQKRQKSLVVYLYTIKNNAFFFPEIPLPNEQSRADILKIHAAPIAKHGEIGILAFISYFVKLHFLVYNLH